MEKYEWRNQPNVSATWQYHCGWCSRDVVSLSHWGSTVAAGGESRLVCICANCTNPTIFICHMGRLLHSFPAPNMGEKIEGMPDEVSQAYTEACKCLAANAPTSAVMMLRKLLMHIAVKQGDKEDKKYTEYVTYLKNNGYVPPNGDEMIDLVRNIGNAANHEVPSVSDEHAKALLSFMGMLLTFIYDFPRQFEELSNTEE